MKKKEVLYYIILIIIASYILRDAVGVFFNPDPANISVLVFQIFLLILVIARKQYTAVGIIGWSILFLTKNSISALSVLLEHGHNDYIETDVYGILKPFLKIALGITLWIIAVKIPFERKPKS